MKVFLGADHAGFELKEEIKKFLLAGGYEVEDKGAFELNPEDDYPDYIAPVAKAVSENPENSRGIIFGGSGQGEAICANRFTNVRAVVFYGSSLDIVTLSREHNNANILSLGARFLKETEAIEAVKLWLETDFSKDERHKRRLEKLEFLVNKSVIDSDSSKDFDSWNLKKKNIHSIERRPFFHEREIWFCYVGANVGFEQDGQGEDFLRPVVIIRKFNNEIFLAVPLSKTEKRSKYYFAFPFDENTTSVAILSQVRLIDARRLSRHIGTMKDEEFQQLNKKLKALLP